MPVIDTFTDEETLTLTIVAEFAAPLDRVWEIYADPPPARADLGPSDVPGHGRRPFARVRRQSHVLHDEPGGREVLRTVGGDRC